MIPPITRLSHSSHLVANHLTVFCVPWPLPPFFFSPHVPWRIHGAGIYANICGILMVNVTIYIYIYIYIAYMDPMGVDRETDFRKGVGFARRWPLKAAQWWSAKWRLVAGNNRPNVSGKGRKISLCKRNPGLTNHRPNSALWIQMGFS